MIAEKKNRFSLRRLGYFGVGLKLGGWTSERTINVWDESVDVGALVDAVIAGETEATRVGEPRGYLTYEAKDGRQIVAGQYYPADPNAKPHAEVTHVNGIKIPVDGRQEVDVLRKGGWANFEITLRLGRRTFTREISIMENAANVNSVFKAVIAGKSEATLAEVPAGDLTYTSRDGRRYVVGYYQTWETEPVEAKVTHVIDCGDGKRIGCKRLPVRPG